MSRSRRAPPVRLAVAAVLLGLPLLFGAIALLVDGSAAAQAVRRIGLSLMVSHASQRPGPVDPAAEWLDRSLRNEFRYQSLHVIEVRHLNLRLQEIGGVVLPTGKHVNIRPLHVGDSGLLIAVDIEGTLQTDLRVANRNPVVIGVERYQDGKLILTLEPDY
jgi:hypothetical protein